MSFKVGTRYYVRRTSQENCGSECEFTVHCSEAIIHNLECSVSCQDQVIRRATGNQRMWEWSVKYPFKQINIMWTVSWPLSLLPWSYLSDSFRWSIKTSGNNFRLFMVNAPCPLFTYWGHLACSLMPTLIGQTTTCQFISYLLREVLVSGGSLDMWAHWTASQTPPPE